VSSDAQIASQRLIRLEDLEAKRSGRYVSAVRVSIARRIRSTPAVLANIRRERRKTIPASLFAAITNELVKVLQAEARALEHEIALAQQTGLDRRDDAFSAAEAALGAARALIKSAGG
jgi:hypothetical protein